MKILRHKDYQPVVAILNAIISPSRSMIRELLKLGAMVCVLNVMLKALWIPTAVNKLRTHYL